MQIGSSFSHRHLKWLGHDPLKAIKDFKKLDLQWIRLGCYWDEIEKEPGKFSFSELDPILNYCKKEKLNVVLTVGMKAPRYPEYYLPGWLSEKLNLRLLSTIKEDNTSLLDKTLNYLDHIVNHFKEKDIVKVWQVENEPLDYSGKKWWKISPKFLQQEVEYVRKLDPKRKILINIAGNELTKRRLYKKATVLGDIVGFDIYLHHPIFLFFNFFNRYIGPLDSRNTIKKIADKIRANGKEFWLAELQAEPFEPSELVTKKVNPPSFLPKHFASNLEYGKSLDPSIILLWGFEWWYDRKQKGDFRYFEEAKSLIRGNCVH